MTVWPLPPAPWSPARPALAEAGVRRRQRLLVGFLASHVPALVVVVLVAASGSVEAWPASPVGWALVHVGYVLAVAGVMAYLWSSPDAARDQEVAMRIELDERAFRARQALELNDSVVQGLATARYALELGEDALARAAMDQTLEAARGLISDLMPEGRTPNLVRERPAMSVCQPSAAVAALDAAGESARKEAA